MRIKQLKDKRAKLLAEADANLAITDGETLTEEQRTKAKELQAKLDATDEEIQIEQDLLNRRARAAAEAAGRDEPATSGHRDAILDKPFANFGDQLVAVYQASRAGGVVDPRLLAGPTGVGTSVPSDGGFVVQKDFSLDLIQRAEEVSVLAPLCDPYEIGPNSDSLEAPFIDETSRVTGSRWGGVQVYRVGEADTVTAKKPKLGLFEVRLEDLMGLAYVTERQMQDGALAAQIVRNAFASEMAFKIDDEIVRGTGAGEMTGVLNAPCLVTQDAETGQSPVTIVHKNISKMWTRVHTRSKAKGAWFHNSEITSELDDLSIPAGSGALEPKNVRMLDGGGYMIKGRPAIEIEQASALGTVGDLMFLDLSEYVLIRKGGLAIDESIHVRFVNNERAFRFVYRINGKAKWRSALTPYKGTATKSPFVALATRS